MIRKVAYLILFLAFLMFWSALIRNITFGQKSLGPLTDPVKKFSEIPSNFKRVYTYYFKAPDWYLKTSEADAEDINNLTYDLFGLYSHRDKKGYAIKLQNLKNGDLKHTWTVPDELLKRHFKVDPNDRLYPAMLFKGYDVILSGNENNFLVRLDSTSKAKWVNDEYIYHHAMTLDSVGNIWLCGAKPNKGKILPTVLSIQDHGDIEYRDDMVMNVDTKTGKVLFAKSLTDIFIENGLEHEINKSTYPKDPFHLNDVEPVLTTSEYMKEGDVFLSFRHLSMIMQYRPSTNKVIKVIQGPFLFQHDVDVISPSSIAILNNNSVALKNDGYSFEFERGKDSKQRKISNTNVLIYNFQDNTYTPLYEEHFKNNQIFTNTEGVHDLMENGDLFFEEQNSGLLWVINKEGVVLKTTLKSDIKGYHYLPNWTRTYTNINL